MLVPDRYDDGGISGHIADTLLSAEEESVERRIST
jgi:hypothetical protein